MTTLTINEYGTASDTAQVGRYPLADAKLKEIAAWLEYDRSVDAWLYSAEHQLIPADVERTRMLRRAMLDHHAKALAAAENVTVVLDDMRCPMAEEDDAEGYRERQELSYPQFM